MEQALGGYDTAQRTFGSSIAICFQKYVDFSGRAPRAEYWWFTLFNIIVQVGFAVVVGATQSSILSIISALVSLALLLPSLGVLVRRLHDTDRSGWWCLLPLIPLVGAIIVLVWLCTQGTRGPNRFGQEVALA